MDVMNHKPAAREAQLMQANREEEEDGYEAVLLPYPVQRGSVSSPFYTQVAAHLEQWQASPTRSRSTSVER